jgi:uncharacterized membrane protein
MAQLADKTVSRDPADFSLSQAYQGAVSFHLSALLLCFQLVWFAGALFADVAYVRNPDMQWTNLSSELLAFGMVFIAFSVVFASPDF